MLLAPSNIMESTKAYSMWIPRLTVEGKPTKETGR